MPGQPVFSPASLKDLVSASGKFLWLLKASEEGRMSPIAALDSCLAEAVQMLLLRYDQDFYQPLERPEVNISS